MENEQPKARKPKVKHFVFDKAYYQEYYKRNREIILRRKRRYYIEHREECIAKVNAWLDRLPDKKKYRHEYYLKHKQQKINEARQQTEKDGVLPAD